MGHGALLYPGQPLSLGDGDYDVVVTGPRRGIFENRQVGGHRPERSGSPLRPYFAAPFGDMMLAGCFGLLATTAEVVAPLADGIHAGMEGSGAHTPAPWDP
jgi:hypothetical protein